jgi:hypothetical protein
MHLTECIDLFSESISFDEEVLTCLNNWLFKTKTQFHGVDLGQHMGPIFAFLCFSYSLGGLFMLVIKPKWHRISNFPWVFHALVLTLVQGPLSFVADYKNMSNDSLWHAIDRFLALFNLVMTFWKVSMFYKYSRPSRFFTEITSLTFAIVCFIFSQDAQECQDKESFVFFHNLWHCYPFLCIITHTLDECFLEEYKYEEESKTLERSQRLLLKMKATVAQDQLTKKKLI